MAPAEGTLVAGFFHAFSFLNTLAFTWIPAAFATIFSSFGSGSDTSVIRTIPRPISAREFSSFLQQLGGVSTYDALARGWETFAIITFAVAIPFALIALYSLVRVWQIRRSEARALAAAQTPVLSRDVPRVRLRWQKILEHAGSESPQAHRLAILEADIMLNELLDTLGYRGETMADKMKQVDRADFNTIDLAWEAHKIRNRIAHEGSEHPLSAREARRIVSLYEKVFREFNFI